MPNLVITGATSFIGFNLIKILIESNNEIYAIARKNSSNLNKLNSLNSKTNFHLIYGDINDDCCLDEIKEIDTLFLLARDGTRGEKRNDKNLQMLNYSSTINLVRKNLSKKLKNIVGIGSQAEYGITDEKVNEDFVCNPLTAYGKAKLDTYNELMSICKEENISFKWFRLFSCYGIGDNPNTLIMSALKSMLNNDDVELSACTQSWNFINLYDVGNIICILYNKKIPNGAYNLASDDTRILADFIYEMKGICNSTSNLVFGAKQKGQKLMNLLPVNHKLKQALGNDYKFLPFYKGILSIIKTME